MGGRSPVPLLFRLYCRDQPFYKQKINNKILKMYKFKKMYKLKWLNHILFINFLYFGEKTVQKKNMGNCTKFVQIPKSFQGPRQALDPGL